MASLSAIRVQICYAKPDKQILRELEVATGANIQQAIMQSGILRDTSELDLTVCRVGIFGKLKSLDTVLHDQDRIEIYRALIADPKDSRRKRADKKAR
jgi:putative ubiquitin-RnfH superfamily antitoxin RatB of RatAB toxin-antitoxin module